jgi:hypothetical protein
MMERILIKLSTAILDVYGYQYGICKVDGKVNIIFENANNLPISLSEVNVYSTKGDS